MTAPIVSEAYVKTAELQQLTPQDVDALAVLPVATMDNIVANFLEDDMAYQGLEVSVLGTDKVKVSPGTLYKGGAGYALRDDLTVDLAAAIASTPADQFRLVAILVSEEEVDGVSETRTFLDASRKPTNPRDPWPTVTMATETRTVRSAIVNKVVGVNAPQPELPSFGASLCHIATVTVSNTAVLSVQQVNETSIVRLATIALKTAALEAWSAIAQPALNAVVAGMNALATGLAILRRDVNEEISKLSKRIDALESRLGSSSTANLRGYDYFVDESQTDKLASGYAARISNGLRFPLSTSADIPIAPQNPFDTKIRIIDNKLLPAYDEQITVSTSIGGSDEVQNRFAVKLLWSNYAAVAWSMRRRGFSVWRVRWSERLTVYPVAQVYGYADPSELWGVTYDNAWGDWRTASTEFIRVKGFWRDIASRRFWRRVVASEALSGTPALAQMYRPASAEMVTAVYLPIERNGSASVRLLVAADLNGNPDSDNVLADVTVAAGALSKSANGYRGTKFAMPHPILNDGQTPLHYVFFTNGHTALCVSTNSAINGYARLGGPLRAFVNGSWSSISTVAEAGMSVETARFANGKTRVTANPLTLAGGIDTVDIIAPAMVANGTAIDYEVSIAGVKYPISEPAGAHPLLSRPSNLPLDVIMTHTDRVAPMIDLSTASAKVFKEGSAMQHNSVARVPPASITKVDETIYVENFDPAVHAFTPKVQSGGGFTTETAPTTTTAPELQSDGSYKLTWSWTGLASITQHKMKLSATTSDATKQPWVRKAEWSATP